MPILHEYARDPGQRLVERQLLLAELDLILGDDAYRTSDAIEGRIDTR
jgi:hypothetical protein